MTRSAILARYPTDRVLNGDHPTFAVLYRPRGSGGLVEVITGDASTVDRVADLPLPPLDADADGPDLLALLPYRQVSERGLACHDDGTPLVAIAVRTHARIPLAEALRLLPDQPAVLSEGRFDLADEAYAAIARQVIATEIGSGEGANFVIRRSFLARIDNHCARTALAAFRRLLSLETGTYWTFVVHCGSVTLIGATPERQVSLSGGVAVMNPISGTYRYPPAGPTVAGLLGFLGDTKETDELTMVVDEELKMMGRVCANGGTVLGPRLREMARLAHTEYHIEGRTELDVRDILRETMFAPTVTGSPLANACRVITRHEPRGRGYYGGALALIGQHHGRRTLDSAILIRTAQVDQQGRLELGVGATLVRHSDPDAEVAETRAKAAALLSAFTTAGDPGRRPECTVDKRPELARDPRVQRALASRNEGLARFWFAPDHARLPRPGRLTGRHLLIIDAEDSFTAMLAHQLRALGATVTTRAVQNPSCPHGFDAVIVGPGPGDPRDLTHPKIARLRELTGQLLRERIPLLSVCLGHQVLAGLLGLPIHRKPQPAQGVRREIQFFGRRERVGFYNTFAAHSDTDTVDTAPGGGVQVSRDHTTGEVHGLRRAGLRSVQFHPESVLTEDGPRILDELLVGLVDPFRYKAETLPVRGVCTAPIGPLVGVGCPLSADRRLPCPRQNPPG